MPRYDYRCAGGEITEAILPMGEAPTAIRCVHHVNCEARRVFTPPAAIHFRGPGFYSSDVKGRLHRKRRPNVGDDLPREFDHAAARIHDAI